MKKIIIAFLSIFYIFTFPVFASEEDILKEPAKEEDIKEEEEIEKDNNLLKGTGNTNNTRAVIDNPSNAVLLNLRFLNTVNNKTVNVFVDISVLDIQSTISMKLFHAF